MFTHVENLVVLCLGLIQGFVLYLLTRGYFEVPYWLILVCCLVLGLVVAAIEVSIVARCIAGKKEDRVR